MKLPDDLKTALEIASEQEVRALEQLWTAGLLAGVAGKYMRNAGVRAWRRFLSEITRIDMELLERHREALADPSHGMPALSQVSPVRFSTCRRLSADDLPGGREALSSRRVAAVVFAGGTATRFFAQMGELSRAFPSVPEMLRVRPPAPGDPKAAYPVTPVMGKSFAWRLAEEALCCGLEHGRMPVLLFMVSDNTAEMLDRHLDMVSRAAGIPRTALCAGPRQRMLPRLDGDGDLLANGEDGSLYWTGDGHGGVFEAIRSAQEGALDFAEGVTLDARLRSVGVRYLLMGNVDNAMLRPFEPMRIGAHTSSGAGFTATLVKRAGSSEKVGVPVVRQSDGRFAIIEYSELPPELGSAADGDGQLLFDCAHVNTNLVSIDSTRASFPFTLYTGKPVDTPSGRVESSSFEKLSQNLVSTLDPSKVLLLAVERRDYFLPTKNITGADSLEATVLALSDLGRSLLASCGAVVAGGEEGGRPALVEISPLLGTSAGELEGRGIGRGWVMEPGSSIYLGAVEPAGEGRPYSDRLRMERDSSLVVTSDAPLGSIELDAATGRLEIDRAKAGRISIGEGATVSAGTRVRIHLRPGETFVLEPGSVVDRDMSNI
ncbi:hypothetical protein GX411_07725 [Candidatus Fermentibacteria bacterium]|nr:hypothetical protein [Candidatus Fermentibacteria bacterium]